MLPLFNAAGMILGKATEGLEIMRLARGLIVDLTNKILRFIRNIWIVSAKGRVEAKREDQSSFQLKAAGLMGKVSGPASRH